jgi:hypothetical protein
MDEERRSGRGESVQAFKSVRPGAAAKSARSEQAQSWIFTIWTDGGAEGANGRRSHVGPEQGHRLFGFAGMAFGIAARLGCERGVRSTCVG